MKKQKGNNEKIIPTIWGANWNFLQYSQLLSHHNQTLNPTKHIDSMLIPWGSNHNRGIMIDIVKFEI